MKPVYLPVRTARSLLIPVVAIVITLSSALAVSADVRLPNIFGDNMVLPRDKPIRVWGWAAAGEPVAVTFGGKTESTAAGADGRWKLELDAEVASSEPREFLVKGENNVIVYQNVLVGDVWVLGGQSNMEAALANIRDGDLELASAHFPSIRLMTVPLAASPTPLDDFPRIDVNADETPHPLHHINTAVENASPLWWEVDPDGVVHVHLVYDQERQSPNRANGHWNFRMDADSGADLTIMLGPFANIYNGKLGTAVREPATTFVSDDGQQWRAVKMEYVEPDHRRLSVHMNGPRLYVARLEPYRISDLDKLKAAIVGEAMVEISSIGNTVEGRELEMIRVGSTDAPHRVLIRARAHPWEPGGNWVIEGLLRRLLRDDDVARQCLATYCLYVMPMANKDGVARGRTRFNMNGKDLNRDWLQRADPKLAPENAALEKWLDAMIERGQRPDLAIDFHNDAGGKLHFARSETDDPRWAGYLTRLKRFEETLRAHSCFTEGSSTGISRTFAGGLQQRYGIPACIHELNADWIAGLDDYPTSANWKKYGEQLSAVFYKYFQE